MFFVGRLVGWFKLKTLSFLFFLTDSKYNKFNYIFIDKPYGIKSESVVSEDLETKAPDPLFHYFVIYKNFFGIGVLFILPFLFILSMCLNSNYFTISNPFFLFLSLLLLYIFEKICSALFYIKNKTKFVSKFTMSALRPKGKLKK